MKFLTLKDVLEDADREAFDRKLNQSDDDRKKEKEKNEDEYWEMTADIAKEAEDTIKLINTMLRELAILYKKCEKEYGTNKRMLQQGLGELEKIVYSDRGSAFNIFSLAIRTFQDTFKNPELTNREKVTKHNIHFFEEQVRAFHDCYILATHFCQTSITGMSEPKAFYPWIKRYVPIAKKLESTSVYMTKTKGMFNSDYHMSSGYATEKMLALFETCRQMAEKAYAENTSDEWSDLNDKGYDGWKGFINDLKNRDAYPQFKVKFDRLSKIAKSFKEMEPEDDEDDGDDGEENSDNKKQKEERKGTGKHDAYDEGSDIKHDIKFDDPDKFGSKLRSVLHLKGDKKVSYYSALEKLNKVIMSLEPKLSREQKHEVLQKFVSENIDELIEVLSQQTLNESLPGIRWRRNNRTGLNKVVLTCKANEYKKSLNRDITVSGKKVKDIICLPKSAKPAGERMKNRRSALKRWKTLTARPAKQAKAKWKKAETRKQSKTIRKES